MFQQARRNEHADRELQIRINKQTLFPTQIHLCLAVSGASSPVHHQRRTDPGGTLESPKSGFCPESQSYDLNPFSEFSFRPDSVELKNDLAAFMRCTGKHFVRATRSCQREHRPDSGGDPARLKQVRNSTQSLARNISVKEYRLHPCSLSRLRGGHRY